MARLVLRRRLVARAPEVSPRDGPLWELPNGATFSGCNQYRYTLWRRWRPGKLLPFVMLNPSTADASLNDPTIRRCIGFAVVLGYDGIIIVNLNPFRATAPKDMKAHELPLWAATRNLMAMTSVVEYADGNDIPIICAWGAHGRDMPGARDAFLDLCARHSVPTKALLLLADGTPGHPLMLPYSATLHDYPTPV